MRILTITGLLIAFTAAPALSQQKDKQAAEAAARAAKRLQMIQKALQAKNLNAKQRQILLQIQQRAQARQPLNRVAVKRVVAKIPKATAVRYLTQYGVGLRKDKKGKVTEAAFPPRISYSYMRYLTSFPNLKSVDLSGLSYFNDRGLQYIASMKTIESLNLKQCRNLTDTGLGYMTGFTNLTHLDLSYCSNIRDAGFAKLAPLTKLKSLNLSYCRNLTDKSIDQIIKFKDLESLDLGYCRNISSKGWKKLATLKKLRNLTIDYTYIDDAGLAAIAEISTLKNLSMRSCSRVSHNGLASLAKGKAKIESLNLAYVQAVREKLSEVLPTIKTLKSINLMYLQQTPAQLAALAKLSKLTSLDLSYIKVDDKAMAELAKFKTLEELIFYDAQFTDKGLAELKSLTSLKTLGLNRCRRITDAGLAIIKDLKQLESLTLYNTPIKNARIADWKANKKLTSLTLRSCSTLTAASTKNIGAITSLRSLNLSNNTWVSSTSLRDLKTLKELRDLDLSYCTRIMSSGVKYLQDLKKLETLKLRNCTLISNIGVNYIGSIKSLRDVDVNGVRITSSSTLRNLRTALPEAKVAGQYTSISYSSRYRFDENKIVKIRINRDLTNVEKRAYFKQLKAAVGEEQQIDYHMIADTEEGVEFQISPVDNLQEFAKRIKFGKVVVDSNNQNSITVELPKTKTKANK